MNVIASAAGGIVVVYLVVILIEVVALWKVLEKANRPGWYAIIPFVNFWQLLRTAGYGGGMFILSLIPIVNIVALGFVARDLARSFGRSGGFAVGIFLLPFIFYPMLGFGAATYLGPANATTRVRP